MVGLAQTEYTVFEGQSVQVCVEVFSGSSSQGISLQILSGLVGNASG